eukprot:5762855-Prymnesium_polylepis.1
MVRIAWYRALKHLQHRTGRTRRATQVLPSRDRTAYRAHSRYRTAYTAHRADRVHRGRCTRAREVTVCHSSMTRASPARAIHQTTTPLPKLSCLTLLFTAARTVQ